MMHTPKPQRPVPGQPPTPPHSQNNSMHAQDSTGSSSMRSPMTSPSPREVVPFHPGIVASPEQMSMGQPVYPTSISSQSTVDFNDPIFQQHILQMLQKQQQPPQQQQYPQTQSQPRWQQSLPSMQMPRTHHYRQQRPMPQDSGYGSTYNDDRHYGAYNGYSQQGFTQGPSPTPPQGNTYGAITASEDARVWLGNVSDKETNPYSVAVHKYDGGHASDRARIVGGNTDSNGMNNFFNPHRR